MKAGPLRYNYSFQRRGATNDGFGNVETDWVEQFQQRGGRAFFRGIEKAQDAASTATQKMIIQIRQSDNADTVSTDFRVVDVRSGETYNVVAVEADPVRRLIELIVESGGADG
ncbi:MAG: head-tail adaptor protein [Pseudomonadota bacterium]